MPSIEVEYIPTSSILRHPRNPKKHPEEQIHRLEASIQKFGWTSPIILSSDGYILAGHARYEAALNQGIAEVPCIRTSLNGDDAIAYLLADNALVSDEWDMEQLKGLFDELPDELADFTGIDDSFFGVRDSDEFSDTFDLPTESSGEKLMRFTMTEEQAQLVENCLSLVSGSSRGEKLFRICEQWSDRL